MTKRRKRALVGLGLVAGVVFLIVKYVAAPSIVWGDSMVPTLQDWDFCFLLRTHHYEPHRGDIVIFRTADDPPLIFVKRVIALPGETIAIGHGKVSINGTVLPESYTTPTSDWNMTPTNLPPKRIYVIGDNRDLPMDTVVQGIIATRLVTARVVWHGRWKK